MLLFGALAACVAALARAGEERTLEVAGERLEYTLLAVAPTAHLIDPAQPLAPTSAINTAKLLHRHLAEGNLEEAALLSNAPKARFAILRESFEGWTPEDFRNAYDRYFQKQNRIIAEVVMGRHRLVMWQLDDVGYIAGYIFVDVEGKVLLDDVPGPERDRIRRVLQAFRAGQAPR
jgi:hypothetical protein